MTSNAAMPRTSRAEGRSGSGPAGALSSLRGIGFEGAIATLLLGVMAMVPARDGSHSWEAQALNAAAVAALLVAYELSRLIRPQVTGVPVRPFLIPASLFAAGLSWIALQLSPWVPTIMAHPVWDMAIEALGQPMPRRMSVDPDLTAIGLMRLVTTAGVFWLASQLSADARRAYFMVAGLVLIEFGYAVYGLTGNSLVQVGPGGQVDPTSISATFSNRNTYATYAGIGVIACAAMTWRSFRRSLESQHGALRHVLAGVIQSAGGAGALWLGSLVVLVACLFLSASRGGVLATACGLATLGFLLAKGKRSRIQRSDARFALLPLLAAGGILVATALALSVFGDLFLGRISESGLSDAGRPFVYRTTWEAIMASPLFGWGYGTFVSVFGMFFDGTGDPFVAWDLAHNTYLEVWLGCGLVAGTLLIAAVATLAVACAKGAMIRERDAVLPALAAAASVLVGLHALVDFSLQYQGVALTYAFVLGIGFGQARSSRISDGATTGGSGRRTSADKVAA